VLTIEVQVPRVKIPGVVEKLLHVTIFFLCADPRIMLDMSAYTVAENGTSVTVCAELSNVLPMSGTTADISTSFVVTDGDAGKR